MPAGQLDVQAVLVDGTAKALLGLADPVLDAGFVQREPFGGGFEAAVFLQEDAQGVAQPGVVVVVVGQRPKRLDDPGPQQLDRAGHQGQRSDIGKPVYLHVIWFTVWIASGVEHYPFGLLTMIVSLEAIFLSTFVMISQNRADEKRQVIADHQWQTVQQEEQQNEDLLNLSNQILELTKAIHQMTAAQPPTGRRTKPDST